ncbi:hypothetical protein QUB10_29260 [Microcoleus sp. B5-D4]
MGGDLLKEMLALRVHQSPQNRSPLANDRPESGPDRENSENLRVE